MHWGVVGVYQAGSGVCTMLLCERKMHFWKKTANIFQAQLPHIQLSVSSVVVDAL